MAIIQMGCSPNRTQATAARLIVRGRDEALTSGPHFLRRKTVQYRRRGPSARNRRRRRRATQKRARRKKRTRSEGGRVLAIASRHPLQLNWRL